MNVRYLTGIPVPQSPFFILGNDDNDVLLVPSDGARTSKEKANQRFEVLAAEIGQPTIELLIAVLRHSEKSKIAFDGLSARDYLELTEKYRESKFVLDPALIWSLRMIKSDREIDSARKAARIADAGQRVASEIVRAGIQEYEIAAEVEHIMRTLGSEDEGHRTIVSSGPRSAMGVFSGYSTDRVINDGDLVIVDTGATVDGYRSDLGRPYVPGYAQRKAKENP